MHKMVVVYTSNIVSSSIYIPSLSSMVMRVGAMAKS